MTKKINKLSHLLVNMAIKKKGKQTFTKCNHKMAQAQKKGADAI